MPLRIAPLASAKGRIDVDVLKGFGRDGPRVVAFGRRKAQIHGKASTPKFSIKKAHLLAAVEKASLKTNRERRPSGSGMTGEP